VTLIAGTDLAASTVAPRQFLAFVSGRLNRLFVGSGDDTAATLGTLDRRPDADGRFRVNDYFCSANAWRSVLTRLVAQADVVMMDLRRFGAANAGCIFEIEALLQAIPAARLVFIVDAATDRTTFESIVRNVCSALPAGATNAGLSAAGVTYFSLERPRQAPVRELLRTLCRAAAPAGASATRTFAA
jgi:hypothetical protein